MITFEFKDEAVRAALARVAANMTNLEPLMREVGDQLIRTTKQRFGQGVSPEGVPWAPKSVTTLQAYRARGDRLDFRPLFGPSGALTKKIDIAVGPNWVEIGSNQEYAAAMQFGAAKGSLGRTTGVSKNGQRFTAISPWGDIPARPFLGISDEDRSGIIAIVDDWMMRIGAEKST